MATILHIETSTNVCSVAISVDGKCEWEREDFSGPNHAEQLGVYIDDALAFLDQRLIPLDAVSVSSGPGSYTGLRIGVSMAKGICYGRDVKLIGVPTLETMCVSPLLSVKTAEKLVEENALLCPMIDARRMEVYAAIYDCSLKVVRDVQADIVTAETYKECLDQRPVYFLGNGAAKCMDVINHPNAHLIEGINPLARNMFPLAERRLFDGRTEDVAYFVPSYLKDYVAKKPKNLLATD